MPPKGSFTSDGFSVGIGLHRRQLGADLLVVSEALNTFRLSGKVEPLKFLRRSSFTFFPTPMKNLGEQKPVKPVLAENGDVGFAQISNQHHFSSWSKD